MQIRRPVVALMTALTLFGGGGTLSGCGAQGSGTGVPEQPDPEHVEKTHDDVPDNSDKEPDSEDGDTGSG
jgi:hypothetical protein